MQRALSSPQVGLRRVQVQAAEKEGKRLARQVEHLVSSPPPSSSSGVRGDAPQGESEGRAKRVRLTLEKVRNLAIEPSRVGPSNETVSSGRGTVAPILGGEKGCRQAGPEAAVPLARHPLERRLRLQA